MIYCNYRYDEWISPDRILGKSNRSSKKKGGGGFKDFQKSKIPPKPLGKQYIRTQIKRGTKSPSPASPGSKPTDGKGAYTNGNKAPQHPSPPIQQADSPSSAKQATNNGTYTRRTRSERHSFSSNNSNGLDEGRQTSCLFVTYCS